MMFHIEDDARPILEKALNDYAAKFGEDLPIITLLQTDNVDKAEALRIFDLVEDAIEKGKAFNGYDSNIVY